MCNEHDSSVMLIALSEFHPEKKKNGGEVGVTVSRTVTPPPPLTIDMDQDVVWMLLRYYVVLSSALK